MKTEKVNYSVQQTARYGQPLKRSKSPNFTGNLISVADEITNALPAKNILKKMKNLEWMKGEAGGILITALGTGLVAPIFIGFNPFVKAPKGATKEQKDDVRNTKLYTAMRQPISAVLAVLFQLGAQKPIDRVLDKVFNNAEYAKNLSINVDQSTLNGKSYLKTQAKQTLKEKGVKKPSIFKGFSEGFGKIRKERKEYNELVKTMVDEKAEKQLQQVADTFLETGKIRVGKRTLDNPTIARLINKQIDDYISDAKKLKINGNGLAFYSKRAKVLISNENRLREMFKDVPIDAIDKTSDEKILQTLYKKTDTILKAALAKEKDPDVQELLKEILDKPEDIRASRISRTLQRIDTIKDSCDGHFDFDKYMNSMSLKNSELDRTITKLKLNKIENPAKATEKTVTDAMKNLIENCKFDSSNALSRTILHDTETFSPDTAKLTKKIYKDIAKVYKKFLESNYKAPNQIIKIIIGVFITLPITCNALNWVYPRFMEIVFPRLAGVKKNGGDK